MKRIFEKLPITVSAWTEKTKIAMLVFAVIAVISSVLTTFFQITIPGLSPISIGIVMLLFSIRILNLYIEDRERKLFLVSGILFVLIFGLNLAAGISQIVEAIGAAAWK